MAAPKLRAMFRTVLIYGLVLALAAVALQWLEYRLWARTHSMELWVVLLAAGRSNKKIARGLGLAKKVVQPAA